MAIIAGWQNSINLAWERPLGTLGTSGFRWCSDQPDSLSVGAVPYARSVLGNRFHRQEDLRILKVQPQGALGATPFWFDADNWQKTLNRLLNSHFQNAESSCPTPPEPGWDYHFPYSGQPGTLGGFTIARDIGLGLGRAYVFEKCIMNKLVVDWKVGQPVMLTPTFYSQNVTPNSSVSGVVFASDTSYQRHYYQAPGISCSWNGTRFHPASFKITSSNNIQTQFGPSSKQPIGFTLGVFEATLEMDVWVDENFYSRFVYIDGLGTSVTPVSTLGTFMVRIQGPEFNEYGGSFGTVFAQTDIYFTGKIVDVPSCNPNMGNEATQKVKMIMTATGTTPAKSGYYIKTYGIPDPWQPIDK